MGGSVSGVGVLDKAVGILGALETGPRSLNELVTATGLPRATTHRLALALEHHLLLDRDDAGRFLLGPALVRLGRVAGDSTRRSLVDAAAAVLVGLRDQTGESAQLYVRSGDTRVCLASLESPHSLRTIVAVGAVLPMDRGSAAKVLSGDAAWRGARVGRERRGTGAGGGVGQRSGVGRRSGRGRGVGFGADRADHPPAGPSLRPGRA